MKKSPVELIYNDSKLFWRINSTLDISMYRDWRHDVVYIAAVDINKDIVRRVSSPTLDILFDEL